MSRSDPVALIRDRVARVAHELGLPVTVMHLSHRPVTATGARWASPPTPRAAIGYLTTDDPALAARQLVDDWCDAQTAIGHTITVDERAALTAAVKDPS